MSKNNQKQTAKKTAGKTYDDKSYKKLLTENDKLKSKVEELEKLLSHNSQSQFVYPKLIENAPIAFTRVLKGKKGYTLANKEFIRQSGYSLEEFNSLDDEDVLNMIHPDDRNNLLMEHAKWNLGGFKDVFRYMYRIFNKEGNIVWLEVYFYAELDESGEPFAIDQIFIDVTEKMQAEHKLKVSEEKYKILAESVPAAIFIYKGTSFVYGNEYSVNVTGYTVEEMYKKNFWELVHPDFQETIKLRGLMRQRGEEVPNRYEIKMLDKFGNEKWLDYSGSNIIYEGSPAVLGVAYDITELKKAQFALSNSEEKYRTLIENMNESILVVNNEDEILFVNDNACLMFGYQKDELIGKKAAATLVVEEHLDVIKNKIEMRQNGYSDRYELKLKNKSGEEMWVQVSGAPLKSDDGRVIGSIGIHSNITERKKYESALEASLQQKELLLKEIHHRVKNNLQIISSLIKLQSAHIKEKELMNIFSESQNRIRTMALIHEKLYRSHDISVIEFYDYVKNLVYSLYSTYGVKMDRVMPVIDFRSIYLDIDTSIPCGLIINEVVSNSLKYAFPADKQGTIYINLAELESGNYVLKISDNGIGIPENIDIENTQTLGLKLVKILSDQLSGNFELKRENGTSFTISFKKLNYLNRM